MQRDNSACMPCSCMLHLDKVVFGPFKQSDRRFYAECFKPEEHYQQQKSAPVVDMNVSFNVTWHKCGFMSMGIVTDVMTGVSNLVYYAQSTIMVM